MTDEVSSNMSDTLLHKILESVEALKKDQESLAFKVFSSNKLDKPEIIVINKSRQLA
jgi:hypothetical protein